MIVRAVDDIQKASPDGRRYQDLRPGAEYVVLSVETGDFRLAGESDDPVLYPAVLFQIVDPRVPAGWVFNVWPESDPDEVGEYFLGPPEFGVRGFWDAYHDGRADAVALYRRLTSK